MPCPLNSSSLNSPTYVSPFARVREPCPLKSVFSSCQRIYAIQVRVSIVPLDRCYGCHSYSHLRNCTVGKYRCPVRVFYYLSTHLRNCTARPSISALPVFFVILPLTYVFAHRRHKCKCRRNYAKWRKDPLDKNCHLTNLSRERFEEGYWLMMQYLC